MNSLRNRVQLIGNPGTDPEMKTLESGTKLARFSMATNEHYKDSSGQKQTETQWHQIVAWGKTAELIERFVKKGKEIGIDGKLVSRQYTISSGETRYTTEVHVNDLLLLGSKS